MDNHNDIRYSSLLPLSLFPPIINNHQIQYLFYTKYYKLYLYIAYHPSMTAYKSVNLAGAELLKTPTTSQDLPVSAAEVSSNKHILGFDLQAIIRPLPSSGGTIITQCLLVITSCSHK